MNTAFDTDFSGEALLEYGDADFMILKPGAYVVCTVTGDKIQLNDLRYWNAELQEAYRDANTSVARWLDVEREAGK